MCVRTDVNFRPTSRNRLRVRIHEPRRRQKMEVDCCRHPPDVGSRPVLMRLRDLLNYALSCRQFPMHLQILKMRRGISNKLRSLLLVFSREAQLTIRRPHWEQDEAHSLPISARLRPTCSVTPARPASCSTDMWSDR